MDFQMFVIVEAVSIIAQFVLFVPFYLMWKSDCKTIGKDNLAVSLKERFLTWCFYLPLWLIPILILSKEN